MDTHKDEVQSSTNNPAVSVQPQSPAQKSNHLLILFLCLVIVLLVGASSYLLGVHQEKISSSGQPEVVPTQRHVNADEAVVVQTSPMLQTSNQGSSSEDTDVSNQKRYTSPKLGISFVYLTKMVGSNEQVLVKESGNKIYLHPSSLQPESGQFLEMFTKNPDETLEKALQKQFLSGKDPNQCFIETENTLNTNQKKYPASYVTAEISFPQDEEFDLEKMMQKTTYCSKDYASTNGVRYFLEDTNYPGKYIFLSIGQYAIAADANKTWQETIVFQ